MKTKNVGEGFSNKNLILTGGLLLPLAIMSAGSITYGFFTSLSFMFITLISCIITSTIFNKKNYVAGIIANAVISSVCYIPVYMILANISEKFVNTCEVYLPVIIIASVWVYRVNRVDLNENLIYGFTKTIFYILGAVSVILLISLFTDILQDGKILGYKLFNLKKNISVSSPGMVVIIVAFLSAGVRAITVKKSESEG